MKIFTEEWFDAVNERLRANDDLQAAAGSAQLRLQQVVTDNPDGDDIRHYVKNVKLGEGVAEVGLGEVDSPDATMTADHASAAAMNKGELDIMEAFSTGKLLVTGTLMQHQAVLTQVNGAMEELRDQMEYAG